MKKVAELASKIEALKSELAEAKVLEKQQAGQAATRAIARAARSSGLLALVIARSLGADDLEREFSLMAAHERNGEFDSKNNVAGAGRNTALSDTDRQTS